MLSSRKIETVAGARRARTENVNETEYFRGEKFTKCSLHTSRPGCIIVEIYWMAYALSNPYARIHVFGVRKRYGMVSTDHALF